MRFINASWHVHYSIQRQTGHNDLIRLLLIKCVQKELNVNTVTSPFPGRRLIRLNLSLTGYPESNTWCKTYPQFFFFFFFFFFSNLNAVNIN